MRFFFLFAALALPTTTLARGGGQGFGLGVALGDPSGINLKKTLGRGFALDGTLGLDFLGDDGFSLHLCALWEQRLTTGGPGQLNGYLGLGGKLGFDDDGHYHGNDKHDHDHDDDDDDIWLGARAPAGLAFVFRGVPIDVFLEIAAILWLVQETDLDLDFALGVRYWF